MKRKHRETRARIHQMVSEHLPGAKVQRIAARKKGASVVDLGGHEIDRLKARAAEWIARHGLVPTEDVAGNELAAAAVNDTSAALSRIVLVLPSSDGVIQRGASRRGAVRAVVLATNTNQVLGEQG